MNAVVKIERQPKPFEGQEKAITILDRNLLVSAGAGSGKTWVLTQRYLEILSHGFTPSQIVAITFTEKAAAEMRERIGAAVQTMAAKAEDQETKQFWEQREQELKYSAITTIHGFCARLLRAHPVEVELDPEFSVLDGIEAGILLRDAFQQQVELFLEEEAEDALLLYEEFGQTNAIAEAMLALFESLRTYHKTESELWQETEEQIQGLKVRFIERLLSLNTLVQQMKDEFIMIKSATKKPPKYFSAFEDWIARYDRVYDLLRQSEAVIQEELKAMLQDLLENRWTKSGTDTFKAMTDQLREDSLPSLLECMMLPQYPLLVKALLKLVGAAGRRYELEKKQRHAVDFHDLEILTAQLLANHAHVCRKWQKRIQYLMVDEFQDTNALQKSIVDSLTGHGQKMKVFVVGDGKQSIYRFRGADVQIFYEMGQEIVAQGGEKVSLSMNFRTQAGIIGYINSLFATLMQKKENDPLYYTLYEELEAHRKLAKKEPQIELICSSLIQEETGETKVEDDGQDQHWVEVEAELLARRIRQMVEQKEKIVWKKAASASGKEDATPVAYGDICVLLAARSQMHLYEFAFQEYGIPYIVVGGRQFYEKQEVLDVINIVRLVHDSNDELSLLGFLRSPMVQLSDTSLFWLTRKNSLLQSFHELEEKPGSMDASEWEKLLTARRWVRQWRNKSKWDSITVLLKQILQDTGYSLMLLGGPQGEQKLANIDKLIHLSSQLVDQKGYHLYDFLEFLKRMQEDAIQEEEASILDNPSDAVVIMSVHASKGLEFPVVCIPELRKDVLKKGGVMPPILYQPGGGLAVRLRDIEKGMPGNGFYDQLAAEEKDRELQEAKRLLYVAMTRARDHLILVGSKAKGKNSWLQWIIEHLGWEDLEEAVQQPLVEQILWKLKVLHADHLPRFTKLSDKTEVTWNQWLNHFDHLSDQDLGALPLLETKPPWKNASAASFGVLSASAFMEFQRCPKCFYIKYVEGIYGLESLPFSEPTREEHRVQTKQLSPTEVGTIVHTLIENSLKRNDTVENHLELLLKPLHVKFEDVSAQNLKDITRYYKSYQRFIDAKGEGVFQSEKHFQMLWEEQPIQGTIDLLHFHPDGTVSIYDFKTNRMKKTLEEMAHPYLWQGYLYVSLVERALNKRVASMEFVFLDTGDVYSLDLTTTERERFSERLNETINHLKQARDEKDFPACYESNCLCMWWNSSFSE
jgi:ATP-dependent helicase/nuclease subunit A